MTLNGLLQFDNFGCLVLHTYNVSFDLAVF